jgi:hypothetical protein
MSSRGFTSAFAAELEAYLAFGEHGLLRNVSHLVPEKV